MIYKKVLPIILVFIIIFTATACKGATASPETEKKIIAVSIAPQETFVKKVCGDEFKIVTMIPTGASPESYEPTPKEMQTLEKAAIYFAIGVPAEENSILPSITDNTKTVMLHKSVSKAYADLEEHGGRDPHIWLSPKRVCKMVSEIAKELSELHPENAETYKINAESYLNELELLNSEVVNLLKDKQSRKFIVFHPAFGYFADDYGLSMYALEEHGKEATAKRLAEMADLAKQENIKIIFYQAEASSRQAEAFAEEINGKAVSLEPLAPDYTENIKKMAMALSEAME